MLRPAAVLLATTLALPCHGFETSGNYWVEGMATIHVGMSGLSPSGESWNTAFKRAMDAWTNATEFQFLAVDEFLDPCSNRSDSVFGDGITGVGFAPDQCGTQFGQNVLAVTLTTVSCPTQFCTGGSLITDADIVFREDEDWDIYSGPLQFDRPDFERVALHELGHALGLGHESTNDAIMQSSIGDIESLQPDDINGANSIYGGDVVIPSIYDIEIVLPFSDVLSGSNTSANISGILSQSDASFDNRFIDIFQVSFANDSRVDLKLNSDELNTLLYFVRVSSTQQVIPGTEFVDDNSGVGSNARILQDIQAGTYWIGASSAGFNDTGSYNINMIAFNLSEEPSFEVYQSIYGADVEINPNPFITRDLTTDDFLYDNKFLDLYQFEVTQATDLRIDLQSADFDSTLVLVEILADQQFGALLLSDDDGGTGTNSRIDRLLQPGTYWIGVTSFNDGETGAYEINVSVNL